ncbi:ribosome biogenesis GTPase Der [Candidatus Peregrinibacteria bacterium CG11_big_fil_rev_8_21_14_0_20_46_8]|nr:MAG: ribosome biogenesis GTPase Der [Candidatus Peregrinibacteria bacterium CG11_big_fil_rev_8_21_14_0_20_46_8]
MLPIVAIIGRPNVGKSTLFNRLCGERIAVTSETAGTTRDRVYHEVLLNRRRAILVDTGGMDFVDRSGNETNLEEDIVGQARVAIEEADIIVFLVDVKESITANDRECAQLIRKSGKPIVLVAHKVDNQRSEAHINELYELGLGEAVPVSSEHNWGIDELERAVGKHIRSLKFPAAPPAEKNTLHLAIVGRPNVGKSSLLNALLGQERAIVSDIPGTTVDSIDTELKTPEGSVVLTDTAGIRRRGRIERGIEKFGVMRSLQSISRSDVVCLLVDWSESITNQDLHVSEFVLSAYKGMIVVVNKIDLMEEDEEQRTEFLNLLHYRMSFVSWAPVLFISAAEKKGINKILPLARKIAEERKKKLTQRELDMFLETTINAHPPSRSGKRIKFYKVEQISGTPPLFRFTVNHPELIHFSYKRFLENELRRLFGFDGTAVRLQFWEVGT